MFEQSPETALDPLDEQLIAYLDGDLGDAERVAVEQRLADDDDFRVRLRTLERSWDMLDLLPGVEVSNSFARSTVEMTVVSAEEEAETQLVQISRKRRTGLLVGTVAVVLAMSLTYWMVTKRLDRPNRELVRDLPVIENVDQYHTVEDIEFLRRLAEEGLFVEPDEETTDVD